MNIAVTRSKYSPLLDVSCMKRECGGAANKTKFVIHMDRYTTEAYPCVVAETDATASQNLELVVETIDLAHRI